MEKFAKNSVGLFSLIILAIIVCAGCSQVMIPSYIKDDHPYKKQFFRPFDEVVNATVKTFDDFDWAVEKSTDPIIYEQFREGSPGQQTLLITNVRESPLVVGTRYARMNAYVTEIDKNSAEVEFRHMSITKNMVKDIYDYDQTGHVEQMFKNIEKILSLGQSL